MQIPAINVNIAIIVGIAVAGLYGLLAGKQRLRILILSVYVGIVLAGQMAAVVSPSLHMLNPDEITWLLLGLPILIFGFLGVVHGKGHDRGSMIGNALVGLCTGALIVAAGLHLLPVSEMSAIDSQSFVALNLGQFYLWILGLLPIIALALGFMSGEKKHH